MAGLIISAVIVIGLFYRWFDPLENAWMPRCLFKQLTGYDCMGCGSQRMIHALVNGRFVEAFRANALLMLSLPFLVFGVWVELNRERRPHLYTRVYSTASIAIIGIILILWTVVRNIVGW